ncbi:hypothetical protein ACB092_01G090700 [Castanea dentata]
MRWCISKNTTWVRWCGGVGLLTWAGGAATSRTNLAARINSAFSMIFRLKSSFTASSSSSSLLSTKKEFNGLAEPLGSASSSSSRSSFTFRFSLLPMLDDNRYLMFR